MKEIVLNNKGNVMINSARTIWIISVSLCLCFTIAAQEGAKKPLKDWDITDAKKPEHVKILKFLKEKTEIFKEDSIKGIAPSKGERDDALDIIYQDKLSKRVVEKRLRDSLLMVSRPPVPEWDKPMIADSLTGIIGPLIIESYWMNEYGEGLLVFAPSTWLICLFVHSAIRLDLS